MANTYTIQTLPLPFDVETKAVLKKTIEASQYLAELKGMIRTIPNEAILLNTLVLQEAKDSSAIENIITTHDELYKADLQTEHVASLQTKEVMNYAAALKHGFGLVKDNGFLSNNFICEIQAVLEENKAGFRKLPGTALKNSKGETVYTPPQDYDAIVNLMANLEQYINTNEPNDPDPLIKMAIIHFQFESIHPFYDGNGRTGRIINMLYLTLNDLLDLPILYLSRYIIQNKAEYYRLLQTVRDANSWEAWILYMLEGVSQTAKDTIGLVNNIRALMDSYKLDFAAKLPKIYSRELLDTLFKHPYTKIEHVEQDLGISYDKARNHLEKITEIGLLHKVQIGKSSFYINQPLYNLLSNG
ncbi:MAG: Fic family protein [Bacteroidota bacterium]